MKAMALYLVGLVFFGFTARVEGSDVLTGRDRKVDNPFDFAGLFEHPERLPSVGGKAGTPVAVIGAGHGQDTRGEDQIRSTPGSNAYSHGGHLQDKYF